MVLRFLRTAIFIAALLPHPAPAETPDYKPGPWHYRSIPCVNTTVLSVTPRLGNEGQRTYPKSQFIETGVTVFFNTHLGADPLFPRNYARVTHYQDEPGNNIMMAEHPGDKVQVCFLGGPAPTTYCDPDKDDRGRIYRVYDYRQRAQYSGINSEHDCGGA